VRLLLDTHTLLWLQTGDTRLSTTSTALLTDPANERHLSVASAWEIAIKSGLKKLTLADPFSTLMAQVLLAYRIVLLPITLDDCAYYEQLPFPNPHHRDPFDRMILVHAMRNGLSLVSADIAFDAYGVTRFW
jgi:PIN domain nuclease of toxin-antitoxin system